MAAGRARATRASDRAVPFRHGARVRRTKSLIEIIRHRLGTGYGRLNRFRRRRIMKQVRDGWRPLRREELRDELVHDTYQSRTKLPEPTRCPDCGLVYHAGRWQAMAAGAGAHEHLCPACQRVRDHFAAGFVTLAGEFVAAHRDDLLHLARNRETQERAEHPLERIMDIGNVEDGVMITTTGIHLARAIGEAVHAAYKGQLEYHYNKGQNLLRVQWSR
jgi:NMD protein affecting ribosome stability and mRNA decay